MGDLRVARNRANAVANLPTGGLRCDVVSVLVKEKDVAPWCDVRCAGALLQMCGLCVPRLFVLAFINPP